MWGKGSHQPCPFAPSAVSQGHQGRQNSLWAQQQPQAWLQQLPAPEGKLPMCCFDFLLKCVITEALPASLTGPEACPTSEPSETGFVRHGGSFQHLLTEDTPVAVPHSQKNRPYQINTASLSLGMWHRKYVCPLTLLRDSNTLCN